MRAVRRAIAFAVLAIVVLPAVVLAHPLGNFTINHYAGLRIEPDRVTLDVVIDQAEIPAFQARQALDANEDGEVSDAELEAGRVPSCDALSDDLHLAVEGSSMEPELTAAGVELRPGVGGLSTLRLVCVFEAGLTAPVASGTYVEFADTSFAGRLGWREIVVEGSGVGVTPVEGEAARNQHLGSAPGLPGRSARQCPDRRAAGRRGVSGRATAPTGRRARRDAGRCRPRRTRLD